MNINRKEIGYTIYSRLEESLRNWLREKLMQFGLPWTDHIPNGICNKIKERTYFNDEVDELSDILEETDLPDIVEIVCYKNRYSNYIADNIMNRKDFEKHLSDLYKIRNKIAHVKHSFNAIDLDLLINIADSMIRVLGIHGEDLKILMECIKTNPTKVLLSIPPDFFIDGTINFQYRENLPVLDYDSDGGFIGRREDLKKLRQLVSGDLDRVITVSGAGGVGKTALVHQFCLSLINEEKKQFDALVWISAKEEKLTLTGIEPIEPSVKNYEEVLGYILDVYGWQEGLDKNLEQKEEDVKIILEAGDKGILLVIDNLETIHDARIIEFIKNLPRPNKVLITSRMGLGEVERRQVLKEMSRKDSVALIRIVSKEKGIDGIANLPDEILDKYAEKMCRYPLVIKWVLGQVALGKDINKIIETLSSVSGDIARFCFAHIFEKMLSADSKMILYCLTASDVPLTRGMLTHLSALDAEKLDDALQELTVASLLAPENSKTEDGTILTKYSILPLTVGYLKVNLQQNKTLWGMIQGRMQAIETRMEEAHKVGKQYRYALRDLGANSEEEKIAAAWALTAFQRGQTGDYVGAVEAFKRAVDIAPRYARVYRNWAVIESNAGYHERANELMDKATRLEPEDPSLWFVWGNMEKKRDRLSRAKLCFEKALVLSPKDGAILGGLGEIEKRLGNFEEAAKYLSQALETPFELKGYRHDVITYTAFAGNQCRWARQLAKQCKYDEAIEKAKTGLKYVNLAVEKARDDLRAQDTRKEVVMFIGKIYVRQTNLEEAMYYLRQAVTKFPRRMKEKRYNVMACYQLVKILMQLKKEKEAKLYYEIGSKSLFADTKEFKPLYDAIGEEFANQRILGKITKLSNENIFGFLERDDKPGEDIFSHADAFVNAIDTNKFHELNGKKVSFVVVDTGKTCLEAKNIILEELKDSDTEIK
ncbi:MAG: cold shock domain-containing protein [Planctomycetes bacterium]|nr:cold shock domain-containing protein [Planctomycetota bacterium]MBU1518208.1 cold shock domain-containing protein [Planctomycetota bacterium]MBU2457126.1 cold shock domain-containing protein [Planctomycetota bacterium]